MVSRPYFCKGGHAFRLQVGARAWDGRSLPPDQARGAYLLGSGGRKYLRPENPDLAFRLLCAAISAAVCGAAEVRARKTRLPVVDATVLVPDRSRMPRFVRKMPPLIMRQVLA